MRVRSSLRRRRAVGLALAACSLAVVIPAAANAKTDISSTDDAPASAIQTQDLRSPDARDAAPAVVLAPARIDLRSPDARDAALVAVSGTSTSPATVTVQPTVVPVVDHGSQTLAIVLSSTALFLALTAVGFAAIYRRPRPRWSAS
jgi:hypothetical protein